MLRDVIGMTLDSIKQLIKSEASAKQPLNSHLQKVSLKQSNSMYI